MTSHNHPICRSGWVLVRGRGGPQPQHVLLKSWSQNHEPSRIEFGVSQVFMIFVLPEHRNALHMYLIYHLCLWGYEGPHTYLEEKPKLNTFIWMIVCKFTVSPFILLTFRYETYSCFPLHLGSIYIPSLGLCAVLCSSLCSAVNVWVQGSTPYVHNTQWGVQSSEQMWSQVHCTLCTLLHSNSMARLHCRS